MSPEKTNSEENCEPVQMPHSMPRGFLRLVILRLLKTRELSGMDIINVLDQRTAGHWQPSPGSIYPMLSSLEENGLIEVTRTDGRSKIYKISDEGLDRYRAAFKRKGVLGEKASMGPRLWEKLLEPVDRARFNSSAIDHHLDSILTVLDQLTDYQKKKLIENLERFHEKLTETIEQLKKEVQ